MKKCNKCYKLKNFDEFIKNKSLKSGTSYDCKECRKIYRKNPELNLKNTLYQREYYRKKHGIPLDTPLKIYEGNGYINKYGYKIIYKKDHPNSQKFKGMIMEHVFVISEYLGRALKKGETVHHKNGIRHDNRIENLELWDSRHGPGQRIEDKIKWYIEFLNEHGYDVKKR